MRNMSLEQEINFIDFVLEYARNRAKNSVRPARPIDVAVAYDRACKKFAPFAGNLYYREFTGIQEGIPTFKWINLMPITSGKIAPLP